MDRVEYRLAYIVRQTAAGPFHTGRIDTLIGRSRRPTRRSSANHLPGMRPEVMVTGLAKKRSRSARTSESAFSPSSRLADMWRTNKGSSPCRTPDCATQASTRGVISISPQPVVLMVNGKMTG